MEVRFRKPKDMALNMGFFVLLLVIFAVATSASAEKHSSQNMSSPAMPQIIAATPIPPQTATQLSPEVAALLPEMGSFGFQAECEAIYGQAHEVCMMAFYRATLQAPAAQAVPAVSTPIPIPTPLPEVRAVNALDSVTTDAVQTFGGIWLVTNLPYLIAIVGVLVVVGFMVKILKQVTWIMVTLVFGVLIASLALKGVMGWMFALLLLFGMLIVAAFGGGFNLSKSRNMSIGAEGDVHVTESTDISGGPKFKGGKAG